MSTTEPIVSHIYTADPSAHVFEGRIYVYPSHDTESGVEPSEDGDQFAMRDYHVLSMERVGGEVTDHGMALRLEDVPWASRQLWSNDVAEKGGSYYMYFPAKDQAGVFRLGVAIGEAPKGPFRALEEPIAGSFSIDPCAFRDDDGDHYLVFGGIRGGQLHHWQTGSYDPDGVEPAGALPALGPRLARLRQDMLGFARPVGEVLIVDEAGERLRAADVNRRFFEAPWVHRYRGTYYLSYSTGESHRIVYATSDRLAGPYTYRGIVLSPVVGWTTHHSIVEHEGRWYLFYHDSSLSGGVTHLRCVKVAELHHELDGSIRTIRGDR